MAAFNWLLCTGEKWENEFKYSLYAAEVKKTRVKRMKLNEAYSNSYPT
jgi:hypothetical protein